MSDLRMKKAVLLLYQKIADYPRLFSTYRNAWEILVINWMQMVPDVNKRHVTNNLYKASASIVPSIQNQ